MAKRKSKKAAVKKPRKTKIVKPVQDEQPSQRKYAPPHCTCERKVKPKKNHDPSRCLLEQLSWNMSGEGLKHGYNVAEARQLEVRKRIESQMHQRQAFDQACQAPLTTMSEEKCEKLIEKYDALLQRYRDPELNPDLAAAYARRAALLMAKKDFTAAFESASIATRLDPYLASGHFQAGLAKLGQNNFQAAAEVWLRGLELSNGNKQIENALRVVMVEESEKGPGQDTTATDVHVLNSLAFEFDTKLDVNQRQEDCIQDLGHKDVHSS